MNSIDENDRAIQMMARLKNERDELRRKEQINKQEKEAGVKYVKTLVEKHNSQKLQLEAKIKTLEDAFDRDKENRQDYLEIQHRRKLKIKDQEINSLKEELKTNKNVVNEIKTNVGTLENRLNRVETERNELRSSTRKLQEENKSLKSAKASLLAKNQDFDIEVQELSQLKNQKHALESDQRKMNQENNLLKTQIDQMRQSFDDHLAKQQEKQTLLETEQISSYQRQIDQYRSDNLTLTSELETYRRQNSEESSAASILRQKVSSLEKQVEHYRSQDETNREKLQKSEMALQQEKTAFSARENQLQSDLEVIRMKSEKGQSEFSSVRSQLNQQAALIKQLESELKLTKSQLENCDIEMIELQRENQELRSQASFTKEESQIKSSQLQNRMTQIESYSRTFEAENRRLEGQLEQANKDLQDVEIEVEKLQAEAKLQEENHREVIQIESEEKITLKTTIQDLANECDALRSENVRMKSTNQKLESEIELFSLEQRGKSTEIQNTKEILTKIESERDELVQLKERAENENINLKKDFENLEKEFFEIQNIFESQKAEQDDDKKQFDDEISQLLAENQQLKAVNEQLDELLASHEDKLQKQAADLEDIAAENDANFDEMKKQQTEVEKDKSSLERVVHELEDRIEELEANLQHTEEQLGTKEKEVEEIGSDLVKAKSKNTELEARINVDLGSHEEMANRIHLLEEELDRIEDAKEDEVRVVESRQKAAHAKTEDLEDEVRELKRDLERVEQEKRDSEYQIDKISSNLEKKYASAKRANIELERENEGLEKKVNSLVKTLRQDQNVKLADFEEMEKYRVGFEKTSGLIEAERERNNQLKHENKELALSETRLRTQMFQLQKINDLLQQQNEELTPKDKKKKMKDKKESPKLFIPPPMYKELEKQIEVLRKENASYKAKLFGSNTDLDKIGQEPTPIKPKRNPIRRTLELGRKSISFEKTLSTPTQNPQPTRSREISADSNTAIVPSICFASSMPIYIGDQIIERNGAKCHQRFIDDFNRIKTKGAKKNEKISGPLKLLCNGKWKDAEVAIRNNVIIARVKSSGHEEKLDLELNLAIHGAVCFEHVNFMAEVDHELCFALEDIDNTEFTYFCAKDLVDKQKWYYNIDLLLKRPKLPLNDKTLFSVEKLHDFNANSSGSFPNILSSAKIGELYLLGTSDALLLLTPSGDIKTLWQDCPVYKIVSNEHFVFFIRGVEREFGFMRIESIRKNFAKINKGTALFNPLVSRNCHTFAIGKFQGKYGVAVGVDKQVKVFVFTHHEEAEPLDTIELDEIPSSLLFTSTSVICGTDPILEIDLQTGQVESYLGPEELAKIYKEKPIEIFRIYSNGHERVLVCATHGGFIVNNGGRIVQTFQWNSIPLSFKFAGDFLFISHFYNLEIIKIGVNQTSLPIPLASYRPRFIGTSDDHVIIYSRPFGSNKTQSSIKLLTGSNRIELDESLSSGPGSFEPLYKSPFNKRTSGPSSLSTTSSTTTSDY